MANKSWQLETQRDFEGMHPEVDEHTGVDKPDGEFSQHPREHIGEDHNQMQGNEFHLTPMPMNTQVDIVHHTQDGALEEAMNDRTAHVRRARKAGAGSTIVS